MDIFSSAPLLLWPEKYPITFGDMAMIGGPKGPHAEFLKDFAKFILDKYKPKALLVFSAHWETRNQIEGNDLFSRATSLLNSLLPQL